MIKTGNRCSGVLKAAGIYAVSIMGCGFATGQEILQFFTYFGWRGIIGTVVSSLILSWFGAAFMMHGFKNGLFLPENSINFYFGKKAGKYAGNAIGLFIASIYVIMASGTGALVNQCFGIPAYIGRILNGLIVLIAVLLGLKKIGSILGLIGPSMVVIVVLAGLYGVFNGRGSICMPVSGEYVKASENWFISSLLYPCFNSICLISISCTLGSELKSTEDAVRAGMLGGFIFGAAVFVINLGFLKNLDSVGSLSIPSLGIVSSIGRTAAVLFSAAMFIGICASSVSMLWTCASVFGEDGSKPFRIAAIVISVLSQILAVTDFRTLVSLIYPLSGYAGIGVLVLTVVHTFRNS